MTVDYRSIVTVKLLYTITIFGGTGEIQLMSI